MSKLWWTLCVALVLRTEGYTSSLPRAWKYAKEDCWQQFRVDGYTASEAIQEDLACE
jgi:hypothetical protein